MEVGSLCQRHEWKSLLMGFWFLAVRQQNSYIFKWRRASRHYGVFFYGQKKKKSLLMISLPFNDLIFTLDFRLQILLPVNDLIFISKLSCRLTGVTWVGSENQDRAEENWCKETEPCCLSTGDLLIFCFSANYRLYRSWPCMYYARAEIILCSQHLFLNIYLHFENYCILFGNVLKSCSEDIKEYNVHCVHHS